MRVLITEQHVADDVVHHVVDVVGKRIGPAVAAAVCTMLRDGDEHIPVIADIGFDGCLHLWPERVLTTPEKVTTLRAFCCRTDMRIYPHWQVA